MLDGKCGPRGSWRLFCISMTAILSGVEQKLVDWVFWLNFSHGASLRDFLLAPACPIGNSLRGDWAIFCHAGSGRVGRVWSAREKSLEILRHGGELNPGHGEDRQWAIPLSYHNPGFLRDFSMSQITCDNKFFTSQELCYF